MTAHIIHSCPCCGFMNTVKEREYPDTNCPVCFSTLINQAVDLPPTVADLIRRQGTPDPPPLFNPEPATEIDGDQTKHLCRADETTKTSP